MPARSSPTGNSEALPTAFAPAERASPVQLQRQIKRLNRLDVLEKLVDAVPNMVLVLNAQRQVVFANDALSALLGLEPQQVIGQRPGEILNCVHAAGAPYGCGTTEFCRECGAARAIVSGLAGQQNRQECRIIQRSGDALDLRVWATPLQVDGEIFSVFAVHDISHEKRRHVLESIFFHDVLNLAGVLLGYTELLETATDADDITDIRRTLLRTSSRLVEEIRMQRDLLAAENGELVVHPARVFTLQLVSDVISYYAALDVAAGQKLVIAANAQNVRFESDPTLLGRVLGNMVKNALEASKPGQTVTVTTFTDGDRVCFRVHNPTVMPRKVQRQLFQRSFSTKGAGRGLGTYSMKLLTERYLYGTITFVSEPGRGTVFTAAYPRLFPGGMS